jgi:hypothetical protein
MIHPSSWSSNPDQSAQLEFHGNAISLLVMTTGLEIRLIQKAKVSRHNMQ